MKKKSVPSPKPSAPKASPTSLAQGPRLRHVLLVGVLAATAVGTWAILEYVIWARLPANLIGKWVVQGGEQDGATVDFFRDGTMLGRFNDRGKERLVKARVRVDGTKLRTTTTNPYTETDETRTQTIQSLTEHSLILKDEAGKELRMSRAEP